MSNAEQPAAKPTALYVQLAATGAGFLVSCYFVSTIVFNIGGPQQNIGPGATWAIAGVAIAFTITAVTCFVVAASRGFHAHRIEGDRLILLKRADGPVALSLAIKDIESLEVPADDGEILARAEGYAEGDHSPTSTPHSGELIIRAGGKRLRLHTPDVRRAREIESSLRSAIDAARGVDAPSS